MSRRKEIPMKGNIEKLAVIVMIAAMAMFTVVTMASADDNKWKAFHGEYAASNVGNCLLTPFGFDPDKLTPNGPSNYIFSHGATAQAIWIFNADGTGMAQGRQVGMLFAPNFPGGGLSEFSWQFTYDITDDGTITADLIPGTYEGKQLTGGSKGSTYTIDKVSDSGMISEDHKTITLGTPTAEVMTFTYSNGSVLYGICGFTRVLTRVGE